MTFDVVKYDNTKLTAWRACALKGFYRHHLHLVAGSEGKSAALTFGWAMHKALDELYTTKDLDQAQKVFLNAYLPVVSIIEQSDPAGAARHPIELGPTTLKNYWEYWHGNIASMELIANEQAFCFDLKMNTKKSVCPDCLGDGGDGDTPCPICLGKGEVFGPMYCGRIDKQFRDKHSGLIVGMDHKTTSMLTSAIIASYKISQQFRGYVYWMKRISPHRAECGEYFYYDIILKTKTKYNQDSVPFYRDTCLAQEPFLDEWITDVQKQIISIQQYIDSYYAADQSLRHHTLPPQNTGACANFNRLCAYYDLCSCPPQQRDTVAGQLFDLSEWNPLAPEDDDQ